LSNFLNTKIYHATVLMPRPAVPAIAIGVGSVGSYTTRPDRNELRGYRRWGYPGAFAVPAALLWADAAIVDAEDELEDMEALEEDLWG
jgi:hypothetical protein